MVGQLMLYVAAAMTALWGVAHLFATRGVVSGFGDIPQNNRRIVTMEWISEGVALISNAAFTAAATMVQSHSAVTTAVYSVSIGMLLALAVVSLFTGFRVAFLPYRLCPFIFVTSAALIALGAWL